LRALRPDGPVVGSLTPFAEYARKNNLKASNRKLRERREETQSTGKHPKPAAVDSPSRLKRYARVVLSGPPAPSACANSRFRRTTPNCVRKKPGFTQQLDE